MERLDAAEQSGQHAADGVHETPAGANTRRHVAHDRDRKLAHAKKEQEQKAKASVVVSLKTGRNMPNESIFGISYLVASAVAGLGRVRTDAVVQARASYTWAAAPDG